MTTYLDLIPGDRVRVAKDIPYLDKGITGTIERVTDGVFAHVDWDAPGYNDGAWHVTNLERLEESEPMDSQGVVYVSGPMTGYDDYNFPAFNEAAADLRAAGWEVLNPADKGVIDGWNWADYLRYDLTEIAKADAIYTLPGWRESKGARLEMHIAEELGIEWINPDEVDEAEESLTALAEECEADRFTADDIARVFDVPTDLISREVRVTSSTGGQKGSKPERYDLIPWDAMDAVARVYEFGSRKYDDHNWRKGYPFELSIASAFRHLGAFTMGEDNDPESGEPHPAHAVFHLLALIAWIQDGGYSEFDTRYKIGELS